jgi:hypothetical protein
LKFSVAEAIRVHQHKASTPTILVPSVTKKPHIPLNNAGIPSSGPSGKVRTHYMAEGVADGDHHDIPDLKPM